jgi:hypothetical protein
MEGDRAYEKEWYDVRETGVPEYPKYQLCHWYGSKRYMVSLATYDTERNTYTGWMNLNEYDTIKEARDAMKNFK